MLKILKYELATLNAVADEPLEVGNFNIKGFVRILTVQYQGDKPVMWVAVDETLPVTPTIKVYSAGTGWGVVPNNAGYVTTLQYKTCFQNYVWHVFARVENTLPA